jgi:hypothetical protein
MIHHISIAAYNPLRVASVLAKIWNGKVYKFLVPGSYLTMPFDNYGTHIVVFKEGDVWVPGADAGSAKVLQTAPTNFVSSHVAISVPTSQQQIEQIGRYEGWHVLTRKQGNVVPLFEFFPPEFAPQYLQTMQPEAIAQILGQTIEPMPV